VKYSNRIRGFYTPITSSFATMATEELVVQATNLRRIQIACSNQRCLTSVTYEVEALRASFSEKCQVCNSFYPKALVAAVEHFVRFLENANNCRPVTISLVIER